MKISVAIATFNGASYIKEQLDSIFLQLSNDDEVIIVDDCSSDNTLEIIKSYRDDRISILVNDINKGVNYSFNKAISLTNGDIIFMADQDDIWTENRVKLMTNALIENDVMLVSTIFTCIDINNRPCDGPSVILYKRDSKLYMKNIINIFKGVPNYYGCLMAFTAELKKNILPFPGYIESHDLWIAMVANMKRTNVHVEFVSQLHRVHGSNASYIERPSIKKIYSRWIFFRSFCNILFKKNI